MIGNTNSIVIKGNEAQLYDTKVLTTANAETGWVYNNTNSYRSFSSSTLPTLFNDISTKLDNKEGAGITSQVTSIPRPEGIGYRSEQEVLYCNGTYFCAGFYYNTTSSSWVSINSTITDGYNYDGSRQEGQNIIFSAANKAGTILILFGEDGKIYKVETSTKNWKILGDSESPSGRSLFASLMNSIKYPIRVKEYNNTLYMFNIDTWMMDTEGLLYTFDTSSYSSNTFNIYDYGASFRFHDILYTSGACYIVEYDNSSMIWGSDTCPPIKIYKGNNFSNTDITDTSLWTCIVDEDSAANLFPTPNDSVHLVYSVILDFKDNKIWLFAPIYMYIDVENEEEDFSTKFGSFYTCDDFVTKSSMSFSTVTSDFALGEGNFFITDDYVFSCQPIWNSQTWTNEGFSLFYCNRANLSAMSSSLDFSADRLYVSLPVCSRICLYNDDSSISGVYVNDVIIGTGLFTDQYIVNNAMVNIDYYKYKNFKICTYSSLTTLNSLYTQYGYSVYWNLYGNQVSIPMNKQNYSVLYVGDDYVDNS